LVALGILAVLIPVVTFMAAIFHVGVAVEVAAVRGIVWNSLSGRSITNEPFTRFVTHGLQNNLAVLGIISSTTVLKSPTDRNLFSFIKVKLPYVVPTTVVVLSVIKSVSVVSLTVGFIQAIICSSNAVEIHVTEDGFQ
jgi:hypothetical protein